MESVVWIPADLEQVYGNRLRKDSPMFVQHYRLLPLQVTPRFFQMPAR
jgi:hypothetical protein